MKQEAMFVALTIAVVAIIGIAASVDESESKHVRAKCEAAGGTVVFTEDGKKICARVEEIDK